MPRACAQPRRPEIILWPTNGDHAVLSVRKRHSTCFSRKKISCCLTHKTHLGDLVVERANSFLWCWRVRAEVSVLAVAPCAYNANRGIISCCSVHPSCGVWQPRLFSSNFPDPNGENLHLIPFSSLEIKAMAYQRGPRSSRGAVARQPRMPQPALVPCPCTPRSTQAVARHACAR